MKPRNRIEQDTLDYMVYEAMEKFGGSFVRALAWAWFCGDPFNRAKIKTHFDNYYEEYLREFVEPELERNKK